MNSYLHNICCKIISTIHVWVCHIPLAPKKNIPPNQWAPPPQPPQPPLPARPKPGGGFGITPGFIPTSLRRRPPNDFLRPDVALLLLPSTSYFLSTSSCSFSFFLRSLRLQLSSSFHTARRPPPLLFLLFLSFLSFYIPSYDDVLPYSSSTFPITTSYPPTCKYSYRHFNFIWR